MSAINDLLSNLNTARYSPDAMQQAVYATLGDGLTVVDPNNPVSFLLEGAVMLTLSSIEHQEEMLRKAYPYMAIKSEELYNHMSDNDFIDRFSQPAKATFRLLIEVNEILNKAVPKNSMGIRKLGIPKDTEITVNGYTFTMQYGIIINVTADKNIRITYDNSIKSPIRELESNSPEWKYSKLNYGGKVFELVDIEIPMYQYQITSHNDNITTGITWKETFAFNDQFFYARVWVKANNSWFELPTTHSYEVIDPKKPTALLKVIDNKLEVYIPENYTNTGMISGDVRVDIYTTSGGMDMPLSAMKSEAFKLQIRDIGNSMLGDWYNPVKSLSNVIITSTDYVKGGRDALSFEELRDRVINNSVGSRILPISDKQLQDNLSDNGYRVNKSVDFVTKRIYHVSSDMPDSTIPNLSTPIGSICAPIIVDSAAISGLPSIKNNDLRLTITPDTLFKESDGEIILDNTRSLSALKALNNTDVIEEANLSSYFFTPFHYILDMNSDITDLRAYYLSAPKIASKSFIDANDTTTLVVNSIVRSFEMTDAGYRLLITTRSGDGYKELTNDQCHCHISFTPRGYTDQYAYLEGNLIGKDADGERIFEFLIDSNLDIDKNHELILNSFRLFSKDPTNIPIALKSDINIIHSVSDYLSPTFKASTIDDISRLTDSRALTHEVLTIEFGKHLPYLWTNGKTIPGSIDYERYEADVYATYSDDIKELDENGRVKYTIDETGEKPVIVFNYLHHKGDIKLDENGSPILLHAEGDIVRDANHQPIIKNTRKLLRRLELFLLDARHDIANTDIAKTYLDNSISSIISSIITDVPSLTDGLLEKTELYYYPETTMSNIKVMLSDGVVAQIPSDLKFVFKYYLTPAARRNEAFLNQISTSTRQVIAETLRGTTITRTDILRNLRELFGDEIIGVDMDGLGEESEEDILTIVDDTERLTLRKKLIANPDGTIGIVDDVTIGYSKRTNI